MLMLLIEVEELMTEEAVGLMAVYIVEPAVDMSILGFIICVLMSKPFKGRDQVKVC